MSPGRNFDRLARIECGVLRFGCKTAPQRVDCATPQLIQIKMPIALPLAQEEFSDWYCAFCIGQQPRGSYTEVVLL
jgi:hypothetical protein